MFSDCVCVTEWLNYGLIVSLAGFCCWHHIGPVKVNYWNMFICCQPLPQAVTCTETQTNTHAGAAHSNNLQGSLCPSGRRRLPRLTLSRPRSATCVTLQPPPEPMCGANAAARPPASARSVIGPNDGGLFMFTGCVYGAAAVYL